MTFLVHFRSVEFRRFILRNVSKSQAVGEKMSRIRTNKENNWRIDIPIILTNEKITAKFSPTTGCLQRLSAGGKEEQTVKLEWKKYKAKNSGAYLFMPDGIDDLAPYPNGITVIRGSLFSELRVTTTSAPRGEQ